METLSFLRPLVDSAELFSCRFSSPVMALLLLHGADDSFSIEWSKVEPSQGNFNQVGGSPGGMNSENCFVWVLETLPPCTGTTVEEGGNVLVFVD